MTNKYIKAKFTLSTQILTGIAGFLISLYLKYDIGVIISAGLLLGKAGIMLTEKYIELKYDK